MLEMRTSERRSLKSCAQQWQWGTVEGLRTRTERTPLWFGSAVHEALAAYYIPGVKRGPHPAETFDTVLQGQRSTIVVDEEDEKTYVDARELGIDMLQRYVIHWGPEEHKEYLVSEFQGAVTLPRPKRTISGVVIPAQKRWLRYHFTYDGVFRNLLDGEVWLDEHKTAASVWDDHLPLDDQAGSYWAFAGIHLERKGMLKPGEELAGIEYNFLRKAMGDTRPVNDQGLRLNKATTKQHFVDSIQSSKKGKRALEDAIGEKPIEKVTLKALQELCESLGIEAHGEVSATQPPPYFERHQVYRSRGERKTMIRRIQDEAFFAEGYRNGDLPITKNPKTDNCRSCDFRSMCELDEQGDKLSVEEFKAAQYVKVDSYEAYR